MQSCSMRAQERKSRAGWVWSLKLSSLCTAVLTGCQADTGPHRDRQTGTHTPLSDRWNIKFQGWKMIGGQLLCSRGYHLWGIHMITPLHPLPPSPLSSRPSSSFLFSFLHFPSLSFNLLIFVYISSSFSSLVSFLCLFSFLPHCFRLLHADG